MGFAVEARPHHEITLEGAWDRARTGLGYVPWLTREFLHSGVSRDDLESEARLGLLDAARRFRPELGVQFITYASFWARRRMQTFVARHAAVVRRPERRGTEPPRARLDVSLDDPVGANANARWRDVLADPTARAPLADLLLAEDTARVREAVADLPPPWRIIVAMRYGLDGRRPMTLQSIGARLGLSRERVRQLESKALRRMRSTVGVGAHPAS